MALGRCWLATCGLGALVVAAGCSPGSLGTLEKDGFYSHNYPYRVHNAGRPDVFVSEEWMLVNMTQGGKPKQGPRYVHAPTYDFEGDGTQRTGGKQFRYELLLLHKRTNAELFLTAALQAREDVHQDLFITLRNYADSIAGGTLFASELGSGTRSIRQRRVATRILSTRECRFSGMPAVSGIIQVADLDQLEIDPTHPGIRLQVVLVRTTYFGTLFNRYTFPVWMAVIYANDTEEFVEQHADFVALANAIQLGEGKSGRFTRARELPPQDCVLPSDAPSGDARAKEVDEAPAPAPAPAPEPAPAPALLGDGAG